MNEPIVFVSRNRVKDGKADEFRKHYQDSVPPIEAGKPGTLVQLAYVSEDATEVTVVRVFTSAAAMDLHFQGASDRSKRTYEFIEPIGVEVYGTPSQGALEIMREITGSGVPVRVNPRYLGGFVRPGSPWGALPKTTEPAESVWTELRSSLRSRDP